MYNNVLVQNNDLKKKEKKKKLATVELHDNYAMYIFERYLTLAVKKLVR